MNKEKISTESVWKDASATVAENNTINELLIWDVCIIGAGISGLTIAYQLLKAGKKVIILDSRKMGENETGNTSAHLSNALDDRYFNIEAMHGKKNAKLAADSHTAAINFIEKLVEQEKIDCDFKRVEGILFAEDNVLQKEFLAVQRCGINVKFENKNHLGKCLIFPEQAQFHPLKYLAALSKIVISMGAEIHYETTVTKVQESPLKVSIEDNKDILADKLVTCANSQFFSKMGMHFKLNPQRSYVIGVAIPKDSVSTALYWDNQNPYHYVRVSPKDDKEDILIIGGEDHRVGVGINTDAYAKLFQWSQQYFSTAGKKIEYQWSGQIIEPIDYLAYIGNNPKNANIYMVTGDSGNGLTHGTIAGFVIADLILKKSNPYEKLYQLKRLPLRSLKNLLGNVLSSIKAYLAYLIPHSAQLPQKGEGKIMRQGFKKVAVYKNDEGKTYTCTAVCSHLGALLNWNPVEKTWDCAAHGSRFDINGKILNGPAMQPLLCKKSYK
jgi:glycine/D-amino acid oxidase-like deaminating enzyme/nitrite reductase/ring-hydroxylating ferredoxin subunit